MNGRKITFLMIAVAAIIVWLQVPASATSPFEPASEGPAGGAQAPEIVSFDNEMTCLALNIYFEARSEPVDGMLAVGHVVLNRVAHRNFPNSICDVVRQGGEVVRHRCQFSWWCDGQSDEPRNSGAWDAARLIAWFIVNGYTEDPTSGALWYHADYVEPYWREAYLRGPQIGRHIFYLVASNG